MGQAKTCPLSFLDLIIPEELRNRHWNGHHRAMTTGETSYGTELLALQAKHRDGQQLSCAFSIIMVKNELNNLIGIASIMRDVTIVWRRERDWVMQLAELKSRFKC